MQRHTIQIAGPITIEVTPNDHVAGQRYVDLVNNAIILQLSDTSSSPSYPTTFHQSGDKIKGLV